MSESRGAASVTLDTIIANALRSNVPNSDIAYAAEAVTDALLAKGVLTIDGVQFIPIPLRADDA